MSKRKGNESGPNNMNVLCGRQIITFPAGNRRDTNTTCPRHHHIPYIY